ncbi:lysine--tRNA ligase [Planctomycetota bacterium]
MSDLREARLDKLNRLKEKGVDPYGRDLDPAAEMTPVADVRAALEAEDFEDNKFNFRIAGRIMAMRGHGKTCFFDVLDQTGRMQGYARKDHIGEEQMEIFHLLDIGDWLTIKGGLFKTRTGEPTLMVDEFTVLSKSLLPLPEKWHGLQDIEIRYRQRYLDLIANEESREVFARRSRIVRTMRNVLEERGFMEVETPMMQSIPGGAAANPFKTHHKALDMPLYLRIAPELFLKRLLVGGYQKVFEINRNFRNEGISTRHNPEFTMVEIYQAFADFRVMMDLTEELIGTIAAEVCPDGPVEFGDISINFARPWKRVTFQALLTEHCGLQDMHDEAALKAYAEEQHLDIKGRNKSQILDEIFSEKVEPLLIDPVFVTEYPVELCPLSKTKSDDPRLTERFELFIGRFEIANAYTELNDPLEQAERFLGQAGAGAEGFDGVIDADFVEALEYGMPPAGGLGIGIDRLVMVLLGLTSIRDVILFPLLRPATED